MAGAMAVEVIPKFWLPGDPKDQAICVGMKGSYVVKSIDGQELLKEVMRTERGDGHGGIGRGRRKSTC